VNWPPRDVPAAHCGRGVLGSAPAATSTRSLGRGRCAPRGRHRGHVPGEPYRPWTRLTPRAV